MSDRSPYLIIGNSTAAMGGIAGIREIDGDSPITLVGMEPYHAYSRPLISYFLGGKIDENRMFYRDPDFYARNNVNPLLGVEATRVDTRRRIAKTADGRDLGFEKLLIATGGKPIVPRGVEGTDAAGVFTFTTWEDARKIKEFIERNHVGEAVIVGGGLIGLKSVEALAALGVRTTVVELADRILSATFDQAAGDLACTLLEGAGVEVRCGTTISRIKQEDGKVAGVALQDGSEAACELAIFAVGVMPDTGIVKGSAIEVDRGILVDSSMRTSVEGIYAAGDVAQATDLLKGEKRCIAIFPNAYRQGLIAGNNMAGGTREYEGGVAMNAVNICGIPTISVGITAAEGEGYDELQTIDEQGPVYKKIVLKENRVVGAIFIGDIERAGIITGLIKEKVNVRSFKDLLLTEDFGLISLPAAYRKHVVSGMGIEV